MAKYENIVMLHDYVKLEEGWYNGFLKFGNNFDWCVNPIKNLNGNRFRDYFLSPHLCQTNMIKCIGNNDSYFLDNCLLPYSFQNTIQTNPYLYVSGTYYVIKKNVALKYPLNEDLVWGQGEDLELSSRLNGDNIIIKFNKLSCVSFLKLKEQCNWEVEISKEKLDYFIEYCKNII